MLCLIEFRLASGKTCRTVANNLQHAQLATSQPPKLNVIWKRKFNQNICLKWLGRKETLKLTPVFRKTSRHKVNESYTHASNICSVRLYVGWSDRFSGMAEIFTDVILNPVPFGQTLCFIQSNQGRSFQTKSVIFRSVSMTLKDLLNM